MALTATIQGPKLRVRNCLKLNSVQLLSLPTVCRQVRLPPLLVPAQGALHNGARRLRIHAPPRTPLLLLLQHHAVGAARTQRLLVHGQFTRSVRAAHASYGTLKTLNVRDVYFQGLGKYLKFPKLALKSLVFVILFMSIYLLYSNISMRSYGINDVSKNVSIG